jgi:hypothetical protein
MPVINGAPSAPSHFLFHAFHDISLETLLPLTVTAEY